MCIKMHYRQLVETIIGRKLLSTEIVHHINGNHHDDRIDNLYVFNSRRGHMAYHMKFSSLAMRLIKCYDDDCVLSYVKRVLYPMIKKSNISELMKDDT